MSTLEPTPSPTEPAPPARGLPRPVVLCGIGCLSLFVFNQAPVLWQEVRQLRVERDNDRHSTVVGYEGISPNPSYAEPPEDWFRHEDDATLLWSGWKTGVGHTWFRLPRNELDLTRLSGPRGRDIIRAIDLPLVEVGGGPRWNTIPWDASVVPVELEGVSCAYPLLLLQKVEVINDRVEDRAYLVTCRPRVPHDEAVSIYDPILDGTRVVLGVSGYFFEDKPVLYDRETESFWVDQEAGLMAIAGPLKGACLPRVFQPRPVRWNDWRPKGSKGRLLVGADRTTRQT